MTATINLGGGFKVKTNAGDIDLWGDIEETALRAIENLCADNDIEERVGRHITQFDMEMRICELDEGMNNWHTKLRSEIKCRSKLLELRQQVEFAHQTTDLMLGLTTLIAQEGTRTAWGAKIEARVEACRVRLKKALKTFRLAEADAEMSFDDTLAAERAKVHASPD